MNSLTKRERRRRVALLCCHFARNLAYYRAGHDRLTGGDCSEILTTINGNFLDIGVLEWCKLFGDRRGKHYWGKVISHQDFEGDMLKKLGETPDHFESYIGQMRDYRDKFLAHLDDDRVMNIPSMNRAKMAVEFLYDYLVSDEASAEDLARLPPDLMGYYQQCFNEAQSMLDRFNL